MDFYDKLDAMERAVRDPTFRRNSGRANEINYWIFDYPPEKELEVRERIARMKQRNEKGLEDFTLAVFDLYDMIIDFLERKRFIDKCEAFEKKGGLERIIRAVGHSMKLTDDDSLIVKAIRDGTPEDGVVFLTGVGKSYPLLRAHNVLNHLHQADLRAPVVLFFPGTYSGQELILFNEIRDGNYYRAFQLVK